MSTTELTQSSTSVSDSFGVCNFFYIISGRLTVACIINCRGVHDSWGEKSDGKSDKFMAYREKRSKEKKARKAKGKAKIPKAAKVD